MSSGISVTRPSVARARLTANVNIAPSLLLLPSVSVVPAATVAPPWQQRQGGGAAVVAAATLDPWPELTGEMM